MDRCTSGFSGRLSATKRRREMYYTVRVLAITLLFWASLFQTRGSDAFESPNAVAQSGTSESQSSATPQKAPAKEPALSWVDPDTGHRVIRLSRDPGSASLYFHQNAYTANGDKLLITTREGLSTINLKTGKIEPMVEGRVGSVVVGKKTRQVFYFKGDSVYATNLDTHATRSIVTSPELREGSKVTKLSLR